MAGSKKNEKTEILSDNEMPTRPQLNAIQERISPLNEEIERGEEVQRKSTTRTFRIYEDLGLSFEKLVRDSNTTQTNLMNEILKQYLSWAQYIINHESPFLTFSSGTIVSMIESIDEQGLDRIIKGISNEEAIDFIKFRWRNVNFRNIVRYLELLSLYANIGNVKVAKMNGETNGENGNDYHDDLSSNLTNGGYEKYEIAVWHHLGKRWSEFLGKYISNLFTSSLALTEANYETSNKSCFVYIKMGIKNGTL